MFPFEPDQGRRSGRDRSGSTGPGAGSQPAFSRSDEQRVPMQVQRDLPQGLHLGADDVANQVADKGDDHQQVLSDAALNSGRGKSSTTFPLGPAWIMKSKSD